MGTKDGSEWTDLVSYSIIGSFMLPPEETHFDLVDLNSVTPSVNLTWNVGEKDLRCLNVLSKFVCCSDLILQNGED